MTHPVRAIRLILSEADKAVLASAELVKDHILIDALPARGLVDVRLDVASLNAVRGREINRQTRRVGACAMRQSAGWDECESARAGKVENSEARSQTRGQIQHFLWNVG